MKTHGIPGIAIRIAWNSALRGFESYDTAPARRHADGAGQVAALRQRSHPCSHCGASATTGTARCPFEVPGVVGRTEDLIVGKPFAAKFRRVRFAEQDTASRTQPLDQDGVLRGYMVLKN